MYVWDYRLRVRRQACEFKLAFYRQLHSELVEKRARCPYKGPAWNKKADKMALIRKFMARELDEIYHIKRLAMVGPIKGNILVLHVRDGKTHKVRPGPSIIDLIQREIDKYEDFKEDLNYDIGKRDGLQMALDIITNPYKYLDEDEQAAYDKAESDSDKIIEEAATRTQAGQTIKPAGSTRPNFEALRAQGASMIRRKSSD